MTRHRPWLLFDPGDPVSWMMSGPTLRYPTYPLTGAAFTALTGLTLTSLYLCQEASGDLADSVGANTLTASGTPTYQRMLPDGRLGVYADAAADGHFADVWTLGSDSCWMGAVFEMVADLGSGAGIVGKLNAGGASDGADININSATGTLNLLVRDTGVNSRNVSGTTDLRALGGLWLGQIQIDRAAGTARARASRWQGGASPEAISGSIAGYAALDGAVAMEAGFGSYGARFGGNAVSWGAFATGVQCEGASLLATIASSMGFE